MNVRWIFKQKNEKYDWCVFRNDFQVEKTERINVEISALDSYYLYINGVLVFRGPVKSYNFAKYYDLVDITDFVRVGKNSVAVVSQFVSEAGIFARIFNGEKLILETDETWKTKKIEALDNLTDAKCPPLEPVRLNEEWFDARKDCDVLSYDYDFSAWENAVFCHEEYKKVLATKGPYPASDAIYPQKFMGAFAVGEKNEFGFRLKNTAKIESEARKCAGEIYVFVIKSDAEREFEFLSGNIEKCALNGDIITNKAVLKKGENLFTAYYYSSDADPYFVFKNVEKLDFAELDIGTSRQKAGVLRLKPDDNFYGWAYVDKSAYKDSDGEAIILRAMSARKLEELADLWALFVPAYVCKLSASYDIIEAKLGTIKAVKADAALKIKTSFETDACRVNNPCNMMRRDDEYTEIDGNVAMFFDFGSEKLGYLKFDVCASAGTVIDVMGFEVVDFNGVAPMPKNCMRYICREGRQTFTSFYKRGMRYLCLTVRNAKSLVKISSVSIENALAAIGEKASFSCDDELINKIYSMCLNTAGLCMSDTYIDCPGYEQVFWYNDAKVTSEVNLTNFGAYDFDYRCLELVAESLSDDYKKFVRCDKTYKENKHLTAAAFSTYVRGGFPLASFHWGLGVYDYYRYSGDKDGTKKLYPSLKKMLLNCENMMSSRGLFAMEGAWNLIEWAQNDLFPCCEVTANSALLSKLFRLTASLAEEFGDFDFSEFCKKKSNYIAEAINKYCWNEEFGGYVDTVRDEFGYKLYLKFFSENGLETEDFEAFKSYSRISEQTNVIVKFCGCVSAEREGRVKSILTDITKDDYKTLHSQPVKNILNKERKISDIVRMGTPFLLYYFFDVLAEYGEYEALLKVMRKNYSYMIECGTDTCWETFYNPGADSWTRSVCHGWGSSPAIYLLTEICGIKLRAPGFKEFSFCPNLAGLKRINAKIPTPHGFIKVEIDKERNVSKLDYPKECKLIKT